MVKSDVSSICNIYLTSAGKGERMVGKGGAWGDFRWLESLLVRGVHVFCKVLDFLVYASWMECLEATDPLFFQQFSFFWRSNA